MKAVTVILTLALTAASCTHTQPQKSFRDTTWSYPDRLGIGGRDATSEELAAIAKELFLVLEPQLAQKKIEARVQLADEINKFPKVFVFVPGYRYFFMFDRAGHFEGVTIAPRNVDDI
jgi:hypothetical protein